MTFDELEKARRLLGLPERATLEEIRDRHRQLAKKHHPDAGGGNGREFARIQEAYRLLEDYCRGYRFDFSREEFLEQSPEERLREQFRNDPLWGNGG